MYIPHVCVSMSENLSGRLTDDQLRSVEPKIARSREILQS
jgi:hypothetical protein